VSEIEQRLQRHVRAMGAMNRQLQAQIEGRLPWTPPAGRGETDLLTSPGAMSGAFITGGGRRAGTANGWLEQLAVSTEGHKPFLVRVPRGRTFLVEGGYRRSVPSGLLVAALERMLGPTHDVSNDVADRWTDGVPVEVLEGPQGPPFVVVGGKRLPIRGLPLPYPVGTDKMQLFPQGRDLNVSEANVSRTQFQRAIYGRYHIDRARSAVARRGFVGATKAAAIRVTRRARRALRGRT
jgi:hypothetical protein